jgi:hypothetical protein
MKCTTFILAVLLLFMNCIPCADMEPGPCEESKALVKNDQHPPESDGDECSPFCYCTCCAVFSIHQPAAIMQIMSRIYKTDHSSFLAASVKEVSFPVWQPPQLRA